jgi:hypothetical protein
MKPRHILIVGGEKGSWEVRGHQLGAAVGARRTVQPTGLDWDWADVVVFVKRAAFFYAEMAKRRDQPHANHRPSADLLPDVKRCQTILGNVTLIGATQAMAEDIGGVYLPHHSRPILSARPANARAHVVAYEGRVKYLGAWGPALKSACARLGLQFEINPTSLSDADIVVAFRHGDWDGEVCRRWKSGVKYANAIAAGRPVITQPCAAFDEMQPPGYAIEDISLLEDAIRALLPLSVRQDAF